MNNARPMSYPDRLRRESDEAIARSIAKQNTRKAASVRMWRAFWDISVMLLVIAMIYGSVWLIGSWAQGR